MKSLCDLDDCRNRRITLCFDETDEVCETFKCEECEWIALNMDKDGNYLMKLN
mgnify:CR=1 FL=1